MSSLQKPYMVTTGGGILSFSQAEQLDPLPERLFILTEASQLSLWQIY